MSVLRDYAKLAVFNANEKPDMLAGIIDTITNKEKLTADCTLEDVTVANGTTLDDVKAKLPTKVALRTSTNVPYEVNVAWGSTTSPTYAATTAGEYTLSGTITAPNFIDVDSKKVKVKIVVASAE